MSNSRKILEDIVGVGGFEKLHKAIYRRQTESVADPMELYLPLMVVPRAILSWLVQSIHPLKVGEYKEFKFPGKDDVKIHIEKQATDVYRGEFVEKGKVIHTFEKQSLPSIGGHFMTVFEDYGHLNEKEKVIEDKGKIIEEHEDLIDKLKKPNKKELAAEAKAQEKELEAYKAGEKDAPPAGNSSSLVTTIMAMNDVKVHTNDPDAVKWMTNHGNVKAFTEVIGKLVDALVTKHKAKVDLSEAIDGIGKEEMKPTQGVKESRSPEEIKKEHDKKLKDATDLEGVGLNEMHQQSDVAQEQGRGDPKIANIQDLSDKETGKVKKENPMRKEEMPSQKRKLAGWHKTKLQQLKVELQPSDKEIEPLKKPYVSDAQRRWAHTDKGTKALGGKEAVAHWDKESKGKVLPEKVSKEAPKEEDDLSCPKCGKVTKDGDKCAECSAGEAEHLRDGIMNKEEMEKAQIIAGPGHTKPLRTELANLPSPDVGKRPEISANNPDMAAINAQHPAPAPTPVPKKQSAGGKEFKKRVAKRPSKRPSKVMGQVATKKAEMPSGAAIPKGPQPKQPPKPPVGPSGNPQAASQKQAMASGRGKIAMPKMATNQPIAMPKIGSSAKPAMQKPTMAVASGSKQITAPKMGKSEGIHVTEAELFAKCEHCGKSEFKKSEGGPEFDPCACFSVLRKDEEGNEAVFVKLAKTDSGYKLNFDKSADPEAVKAFLLSLKAHLLLKKMGM